MTLFAIVLAFAMTALDDEVDWNPSTDSPLGYAGRPDGARAVLAAVAGSTITAAATAFSITITTLALASSQFGPRLLRNFISDRGIQLVLGIFIGTFVYCLLVLRTIFGNDETDFVPQISITVAFALALVSIIALIYFIHHVATSIQVTSIIRGVSNELERSINRLYDAADGDRNEDAEARREDRDDLDDEEAGEISCRKGGYLQAIDSGALVKAAAGREAVIKVKYHAGRFVVRRGPVALVWPKEAADEGLEEAVNDALDLGEVRTSTQDVEYAVDQLVEIAVRALSPGINDPFTALSCIDRLGSALVRIVEREPPEPRHWDDNGKLRAIVPKASFSGVVDAAFNMIRHHGGNYPAVLIRLLETISVVARRTENEEQRDCLLEHAEMINRAVDALPEEHDKKDARQRYRELLETLDRARQEENGSGD